MKKNYIGKSIQNKNSLKKYDLIYVKHCQVLACVAGIGESITVETVLVLQNEGLGIENVGVEISSRWVFENYETVVHNKFWIFGEYVYPSLILIHRFKGKKPTVEQIKEVYNKYLLKQNG